MVVHAPEHVRIRVFWEWALCSAETECGLKSLEGHVAYIVGHRSGGVEPCSDPFS